MSGPKRLGDITAQLPAPKPSESKGRGFRVSGEGSLLPPGEYALQLVKWETRLMFGNSPKVVLTFRVMAGPHISKEVCRYYNAAKLFPPMGEGGEFEAQPRSDLFREYEAIREAAGLPDEGLDAFKKLVIRGLVGTTEKNRDGEPLPLATRYSRVIKILGVHKYK